MTTTPDTQVDGSCERRGKAVTVSLHSRFPIRLASRIMSVALEAFGQDGRVKVAPKISQSSGRSFFVVASSQDPQALREACDRALAEVMAGHDQEPKGD